MDEINSPIIKIPGISYTLASTILAEIGDIHRFETPSQLQAFAGLDPGTYQSGKFTATNTKMVKRGSSHLRYALLQASRLVCMRDGTFKQYYEKKKLEGKHYYVCLTHVAKKLLRVIFKLLTTNTTFISKA